MKLYPSIFFLLVKNSQVKWKQSKFFSSAGLNQFIFKICFILMRKIFFREKREVERESMSQVYIYILRFVKWDPGTALYILWSLFSRQDEKRLVRPNKAQVSRSTESREGKSILLDPLGLVCSPKLTLGGISFRWTANSSTGSVNKKRNNAKHPEFKQFKKVYTKKKNVFFM